MTATVFVDTAVFLYAHQRNDSVRQPLALRWLDYLWEEQTGRTSIQVLSEVHLSLTRAIQPPLSSAAAWDRIRPLFAWNPQPTDTEVLHRAHTIEERYRLSWWDSLVVAAAQVQNCTLLLSEDIPDHSSFGSVMVRNPFQLGVAEAAATYAATPFVKAQHPRTTCSSNPSLA